MGWNSLRSPDGRIDYLNARGAESGADLESVQMPAAGRQLRYHS